MSQAQRNLPAQQRGNTPEKFSNFITGEGVRRKINDMIGGKDGQRFITSIVSAVSTNPALAECDHGTILSAAMVGESLKLSPSPQLGQFYMVPFNDRKNNRKVAQFQIGYKGYIQLALRTGYYRKLNVLSIKQGELIRYDPLFEEIEVDLIQDDSVREATPTCGYYAMFEYLNGFRKTLYWSRAKMEAHADRYSQAFSASATTKTIKGTTYNLASLEDYQAGKYNSRDEWLYSSFWYKDFDGMAYKTMLRQIISKWGIMSIEMQTAMDADMGVVHDVGGPVEYVDNSPVVYNGETTSNEDVVEDYVDISPLLTLMPADTDETKLREFLEASSRTSNAPMTEVVDGAIEQIDGFKGHYANWLAKNAPKPESSESDTEKADLAAVRIELAERRAKLNFDITAYELDRKQIETACNNFIEKLNRTQLEKAEAMVADMIAAAEQQMSTEDTAGIPEKITCPNSKTIVRPAVECVDCPKNNGCPALS